MESWLYQTFDFRVSTLGKLFIRTYHVWVPRKAVWSFFNTCHTWALQRWCIICEALYKSSYFTLNTNKEISQFLFVAFLLFIVIICHHRHSFVHILIRWSDVTPICDLYVVGQHVLLYEVEWWRFVTLFELNWISWFKKYPNYHYLTQKVMSQ